MVQAPLIGGEDSCENEELNMYTLHGLLENGPQKSMILLLKPPFMEDFPASHV